MSEPMSIERLRDWRDSLGNEPSEVPADVLRNLIDDSIRLQKIKSALPYLECPCCGSEGAFPIFYEDGQPTICGCGGRVSCRGGDVWINVHKCEGGHE